MTEKVEKKPAGFLMTWAYAFMFLFGFGISGVRLLTSEFNREAWQYTHWIIAEHFLLLGLAALIVASLWHGLLRTSRRCPGARRTITNLVIGFVAANGAVVLAFKILNRMAEQELAGHLRTYAEFLIVAILLPFLILPRLSARVGAFMRVTAKILLPLPFVLLVYFLTLPQAQAGYDPPPKAPPPASPPAPVIFLVLDSLDRERTTAEPDAMLRLPSLSALVDSACVFTDTATPGLKTRYAMPCFLYQDAAVQLGDEGYVVVTDGAAVSVAATSTVYDLVGRSDDVRVMLGFHVDFNAILGNRVDWLQTQPMAYTRFSNDPAWNLRSHVFLFAFTTLVPLLSRSDYVRSFPSDSWDYVAHDVFQSSVYAVQEYGGQLVGVFHLAWPHPPFLYDRDGRRDVPALPEDELYLQNLEYADARMGEMFHALRNAGLWDSATIIVTSDHGFPHEDDSRYPPIIIKLPGQTEGRVETEPLNTADIVKWLHRQPEFTALRPPRE